MLGYATPAAVYTKGVQIAPNTPAVGGGAVASYSVTPALPAGLSLSSSTGIVSGTPTAVAASAGYMVTAANASGSTAASLSITVNDQPPSALNYGTGTAVYTTGVQISPDLPTNSGGTVISYSVTPALPPGLTLNPLSGILIGSPAAVSAATNYTVTATNSGGSTKAALNITVIPSQSSAQLIPNLNQQITPLAPNNSNFQSLIPGLPNYPNWQAGQAVSSVVSPDGKTLLVLTSGFNRIYLANNGSNPDSTAYDYPNSQEYVFIYDISQGAPLQKQVVTIPNSYSGIVFDPIIDNTPTDVNYGRSTAFYVSSGSGDYPFDSGSSSAPVGTPSLTGYSGKENVHVFTLSSDGKYTWSEQQELVLTVNSRGPDSCSLGFGVLCSGLGLNVNVTNGPASIADYVPPMAAGVAISSDGQTLAVANYANDSISVFTGGLGNWTRVVPDIDLRPGDGTSTQMGTPGGEYPFWVVIQGTGENATAYVSSIRDREIDVVSLGSTMKVTGRIPVVGEPIKMTMNKAQTRLYVAVDMSDTIDDIDISSTSAKNGTTPILETIKVAATPALLAAYPPLSNYRGANTNSVTLSPDESQLYVTNGNLNAVAVVQLAGADKNDQVAGLIPTGWYPNSVSFSGDGATVYVVNGKSPTGPNPGWCYGGYGPGGSPTCLETNQYSPQLTKAGFQSFPLPGETELASLTAQVARNNGFGRSLSSGDIVKMANLRSKIQHVIFIIKENRTYDQVLGDLPVGNGDPDLTEFGQTATPNLHSLAQTFVTLDNFYDRSEVSMDGWPWTVSARSSDVVEKQVTVNYAGRGLSNDSEGTNRNVNVSLPTLAARLKANPLSPNDPDVLPGTTDTAAPDGPEDQVNTGYLWDAALRAGLTIRNYGFFIDLARYQTLPGAYSALQIPLLENPFATGTTVAYPTNAALSPYTDPYFRGFDNNFPDYDRFTEWQRDFTTNYAKSGLPQLSFVRFMHDHTGNFATAIDGVNTPELQEADNDYAVGLLVQQIANSVYKNNTLIFVIEDDSQDGADHVDSHRSIAFVAGPYVKQGAVVSTQYNTVDFLRTIEAVLNIAPLNINDALAVPMADVFDLSQTTWSFTATASTLLKNTTLPLASTSSSTDVLRPTHDAAYWAKVTRGMDFSAEDRFDFAQYNRILWQGLMGNKPYPATPSGLDLRSDRAELLARYRKALQQQASN